MFLINAIRNISIQERLTVIIRFLAIGDSYASLQVLFKISKQLIKKIENKIYTKDKCHLTSLQVYISRKTAVRFSISSEEYRELDVG